MKKRIIFGNIQIISSDNDTHLRKYDIKVNSPNSGAITPVDITEDKGYSESLSLVLNDKYLEELIISTDCLHPLINTTKRGRRNYPFYYTDSFIESLRNSITQFDSDEYPGYIKKIYKWMLAAAEELQDKDNRAIIIEDGVI